jgi:hypothetical protein
LALTTPAIMTPAHAVNVCEPCPNDIDIRVEVPVGGKNYAGPTKYEGDIDHAFGKSYTVEIVIDGVLKPVVTQTRLNPGAAEFVRWTTASLKLANGPHVMLLTITDLAQPACPLILSIPFRTFGA